MAFFDTTWYVNSVGWTAVTAWASGATIAAGALRRQLAAPTVGNERVFVAIVGGTTGGAEPAWVLTRGGKTTDNAVTWQEVTGASAVNGDLTNTPNWTAVKNQVVTLGQIIQRNNGASYQIASTGGTAGNGAEPGFSDTAGTTTADNTVTWTSLGVVGNFAGGAAPHARTPNAIGANWAGASATMYVADNHAETSSANIVLAPTGSTGSLQKWLCNKHLGSYPPAAGDITTGATVTATNPGVIGIGPVSGGMYFYGITFSSFGTTSWSSSTTGPTWVIYDNCSLQITSGGWMIFGLGSSTTSQCKTELRNTTVKFSSTAQAISVNLSEFVWKNTGQILASGSSVPQGLFFPINANGDFANITLEALDLSQLSSSSLINANGSLTSWNGRVVIKDCKIPSSFLFDGGTTAFRGPGLTMDVVRCHNSANYTSQRNTYYGVETTETTIVRTGGATDGTQAESRKIVTNASTLQWLTPYEAMPISIWNNTVGVPITLTLFGIWGGGAVPNNDDIWMDVEYLGSSTSPLGTLLSGTKASFTATGAAQSSDGSTWGGSTTPFKMTATFTPQQAGPITIYVKAAKQGTTFYIDPQPSISGVNIARTYALSPNVLVSELKSIIGFVAAYILGG